MTETEIYSFYKNYIASEKYPYLSDVENYITEKTGHILSEPEEMLLYKCSIKFRYNEKKSQGFLNVGEVIDQYVGKSVYLLSESFFGSELKKVKVVKSEGCFYFMKPRARTRGIFADSERWFKEQSC